MRWPPSSNSAGSSQPGKQKSRATKSKKKSASQAHGNIWGTTLSQLSNLSGVLEEPESDEDVVDVQDTQADPEDEFLGSIRSDIVGVQYYKGTVSNNEMVNLVREPNNPYDRNAVRVDNVTNEKVGHIKREHAKPLSFIIDDNLAKVEGLIPFGANNKFRIPAVISLWGSPSKRDQVVAILKSHYITVDTNPVKRVSSGSGSGFGASYSGGGQADYDHVVSHRTFVSPSEMENAMDQMFETLDEGDKTTEANPAQAVRTGLYPHQKQALNWMICRENNSILPPFWEKKDKMYINTLTMCHTLIKPASVCGGILADDMGLGKTLQVISLVLTNFVERKPLAYPIQGSMRCPMGLTGKTKGKMSESKSSDGKRKISYGENQQSASKAATSVLPCSSSNPSVLEANEKVLACPPNLIGMQAKETVLLPNQTGVQAKETVLLPNQTGVQAKETVLLPNQTGVQAKETVLLLNTVGMQAKETGPIKVIPTNSNETGGLIEAVVEKNMSKSAVSVKDPDYTPDVSDKVPVVAPVSRSRRERKRPVRYCYSDEEDEQIEEEGNKSRKGKRQKKGEKGKTLPLKVADSNKIENLNEIEKQIPVPEKAENVLVSNVTSNQVPVEIKENTELLQTPTTQACVYPDNHIVDLTSMEVAHNDLLCRPKEDFKLLPTTLPLQPNSECFPNKQIVDLTALEVVQNIKVPIKSNEEVEKNVQMTQSYQTHSETAKIKQVNNDMTKPHITMDTNVNASLEVASEVVVFTESIKPLKGLDNTEVIVIDDPEDSKEDMVMKCSIGRAESLVAAPKVDVKTMPIVSNFLQKAVSSPAKRTPKSSCSPQQPMFVFDSDDEDLPDIPPSILETKTDHKFVKLGSDYDAATGRAKTSSPRGTLIICPLSVISNWVGQFEEHVDQQVHISLYVYYGASRKKDVQLLKQQDVVITTYSTLASDFKGVKQSPLHKVEWLRLVLDEAHIIRNPASNQAKAVYQLQAQRKWAITGTPIQNSMKDLWSLINFLGVKPFTDRTWWNRTIARPLAQRESKAIQRVPHLMRNLALRRTKNQQLNGRPLITLPDRHVYLEKISFGDEERAVYEAMQANGKVIIGRYFQQGTLLHHYGEVLAILTRLRQLCCHPLLVASAVRKVLESNPGAAIHETAKPVAATGVVAIPQAPGPAAAAAEPALSEEERQRLINQLLYVLDSGSDQECAICLDSVKRGVITACAHVYCRPCIEAVIENEQPDPKCPLCRGDLKKEQLIEAPEENSKQREGQRESGKDEKVSEIEEPLPTPEDWQSSAKIDALMKGLTQLRQQDPTIKSIVLSQFTSLLDLIAIPLGMQGFHFARLDGRMSAAERIQAVEEFSAQTCGAPTVFLLSLKAGGVGINLTAASRVFLMDPAWNPASEEQCFDRCHRLGQTRDVVITRFVIDDTVEERMLELQEKKRQLMKGAFGKTQSKEERRTNLVNMIRNLIRI